MSATAKPTKPATENGKEPAAPVSKAAQHKIVGMLNQKLAPEGIYVGEVVVLGTVKGTAFDGGNATIEASAIAERFWDMHQNRAAASVHIS